MLFDICLKNIDIYFDPFNFKPELQTNWSGKVLPQMFKCNLVDPIYRVGFCSIRESQVDFGPYSRYQCFSNNHQTTWHIQH